MRRRLGIGFMVTMAFLAFTPFLSAQTYKYVDKNGVPHFTNVPNSHKYKPASSYINHSPKKKNPKPTKKIKMEKDRRS